MSNFSKIGRRQRIFKEALYLINNQSTIRKTALYFQVGKSTIHIDIVKRLKTLDFNLYKQARKILDQNIKERSFRGGEATRKIFEEKRKNKNLLK